MSAFECMLKIAFCIVSYSAVVCAVVSDVFSAAHELNYGKQFSCTTL